MALSLDEKRAAIEKDHERISVERQCELLGLNRSLRETFYGSRRITGWPNRQGYAVNRKRVARLMDLLGLQAIYPEKKRRLSGPTHKKYPYLLRGVVIEAPNQAWSADTTYIRLGKDFVYLCAVMDWYSRYVLSWKLSSLKLASVSAFHAVPFLFYRRPLFQCKPGSEETKRSHFTLPVRVL